MGGRERGKGEAIYWKSGEEGRLECVSLLSKQTFI